MPYEPRVGCHNTNFEMRVAPELLNYSLRGLPINTPALIALDPTRPEWGKPKHLAHDLGVSYRTAVRYVENGIVDVRTFSFGGDGVPLIGFRWNVTSARAASLAYEAAKSRDKAERYRSGSGVLLQGGSHKRRTVKVFGTVLQTDEER